MTNPDNVGGLLPCPFCGGESERIDFGVGSGDNEGGSCIACKKCQASGPVEFGYKENFVSNWNRRKLYSASSGDAGGLPELPPSYGDHCVTDSVRTMREPGYTADQMRAYGELCRAAPAGGDVERDAHHERLYALNSAPAGSGEVADWMVRVALDASRATEVKMGSLSKAPDEQRMRNALAALIRKLQQGAEYVMVPREPSNAMVLAAIDRDDSAEDASPDGMYVGIYRAMVDASDRGAK